MPNTQDIAGDQTQDETEDLRPVCDHCQDFCSTTRTVRVRSANTWRLCEEEWCISCVEYDAIECADCDELYRGGTLEYSNSNGHSICESCAEEYFTCESCENICPNSELRDNDHCVNCSQDEEDEEDDSNIASYNSEVNSHPVGTGPHYFGVELEVECSDNRSEHADKIADVLNGFAGLKEDGSLRNGFEIVTRPASLAFQRVKWASLFSANAHKGLKSWNTQTCGLHVHCSRRPLTEFQIAKIVCFVNANHNRRFMATIAGRTSVQWAAYHAKKISEGNKYNSNRYEAVNLQNADTIEFRIFKGTLKLASILKAIEFCDALISFCRPGSRSLRETMMRSEFTLFVRENKKQWPHLYAFIESRWYGHADIGKPFGWDARSENQELQLQSEEQ